MLGIFISAAIAASGIATSAAALSDAIPETSYEAFVAGAEERFPGPFDREAFKTDHPQDDWRAVVDRKVVVEPLAYTVDGLNITGMVVRPRKGRRLPILVWSRGGVGRARIDPPQLVEMGWWARRGYVVVASNFRGAGGSEGEDEFGGADLRDLSALVPIATRLPAVDPGRIYGIGFSRGGMMLLQAAAGGMPLRAMATVGAPTDLAALVAERPDIDSLLRQMAPDYEAERAGNYCRRSAVCWADRLKAPLYLVHGAEDRAVPPSQVALLADRLRRLGRRHKVEIVAGGDHGISGHRRRLFVELDKFFSTPPEKMMER